MCGIVGWSLQKGTERDLRCLEAMSVAIAHRGPDDDGIFVAHEHGVALAHRRLSIIDLSPAAHQPMTSDDGTVTIAFNGELYNFVALRAELAGLGRRFSSRSDTEVAANAIAQWGLDALSRFNGMFALAAWNVSTHKMLLARDPLGMKPLYYTQRGMGGGTVFASELKAFLSLPGFRSRMDPNSLAQFLEFGYVFGDTATALEGVFKLPPGQALELAEGRVVSTKTYYVPGTSSHATGRKTADVVDELHASLSGVVREHLVADVPVGLLLSGGLDSSVLAAMASREAPLTTISMGFAESRIDERPNARAVAAHIGSEHQEHLIRQQEVIEHLEDIVWYFDDLFADWGTLTTRLLYRKCREQGIKVVLVGEGADELFGGYPVFDAARRLRGPMAWRLFQLYRRYAGRRYGGLYPAYASIMREYLHRTDNDLFEAVRLFEARNQLPSNYVMKVDKASMSVSVEARAPYLDRRIADQAFAIPATNLLAGGTDKLVLRELAERHKLLPSELARRPKFGASIATTWMDESEAFRGYAASRILARNGWADRLGLRGAMTDFFAGRRQGYAFPRAISLFGNLAWRLLLLDLWAKKYLAA